jgi:methylthioribose-1-phosphate isomerase
MACPFYALVQDPRSLERGSDVPIEERPAHELLTFQGQSLLADSQFQLKARYPAFDVTPAQFITQLIGFDDLYTPETFRQKYQWKNSGEASTSIPPVNTFCSTACRRKISMRS